MGLESRIDKLEEQVGTGTAFGGLDMRDVSLAIFSDPQPPVTDDLERLALLVIAPELAESVEHPRHCKDESTLSSLALFGLPDTASRAMVAERAMQLAEELGYNDEETERLREALAVEAS